MKGLGEVCSHCNSRRKKGERKREGKQSRRVEKGKMELPIITAKTNARNKVKYTIITTIDEREDKAETGVETKWLRHF